MRLWHVDLIDVLPRKQLLSQWRECCAIAKSIADKGTPNHILVNKITDYSQIHFIEYTNRVLKELGRRNYLVSEASYLRFVDNLKASKNCFYDGIMINKDIYPEWMNHRYLKQCYYNLQEKYDCGGISEDEWKKIYGLYMSKREDNYN